MAISEQDVTMVLMHEGYPLADGGTANFVAGMKDCLTEGMPMNSTPTNVGGWNSSELRVQCNTAFLQAIPDKLRSIFKPFKTTTDNGAGMAITSDDNFSLAAEKEVFGANTYGYNAAEAGLFQFDWYKTAANRRKKITNQSAVWWERSTTNANANRFCVVGVNGSAAYSFDPAQYPNGVSPFGCI